VSNVGREILDESRIVVGKPLPFSIYKADGKLLLAEGRMVETDRLRDLLLRSGYRTESSGGRSPDAAETTRLRAARDQAEREAEEAALEAARITPLERLHKDYSAAADGRYLSISMAKSEAEKAFPVQLMGVHSQSIIVTAPVHPDGSLVAILAGQAWLCRTFQMTSVFRFTAAAVKVAYEPFPHVYLSLKKEVEHRRVRGAPRAKVALRGDLLAPEAMPCFIDDLSTSGARLAIDSGLALEKGSPARLNVSLEILGSQYELSLDATIAGALGPIDSRHPECAFYGLKFGPLSERDRLVLHGYIGDHLVSEFHSLWQMLRMASRLQE
jgi:hypothetical protein